MKTLGSTRRAGFSLVEILAVIAILGLLAALAAGAFFRVSASQRVNATEATVEKLMALVEKKRSAVVDGTKSRIPVPADVLDFADNDPDRAKAIWIYMNLKQEFPTTRTEATTDVGPLPTKTSKAVHRSYFDKLPSGTYPSSEHESAACLYLALTQSGISGVTMDSEGLQNQTTTFTVGSTAVTAFADAWGTPVALVRLTFTPEIDTSIYATRGASKDAIDPLGKLGTAGGNWTTSGSGNRLGQFWDVIRTNHLASANVPATYPTPTTRANLIAVVSAGPDKNFGTLFGTEDAAADNIVSYRLKAGFKGQ